MGFAIMGPLARTLPASYLVLVPRLATTPLRFAITSPPSRCEEELHLQAIDPARHTPEKRARNHDSRPFVLLFCFVAALFRRWKKYLRGHQELDFGEFRGHLYALKTSLFPPAASETREVLTIQMLADFIKVRLQGHRCA